MPQKLDVTILRKPLNRRLLKIDREVHGDILYKGDFEDTDSACFYHASDCGWACRQKPRWPAYKLGPVIGYEYCTISHKLKRQTRFARAGRSQDNKCSAIDTNSRSVDDLSGFWQFFHGLDGQAYDKARAKRLGRYVCLSWTNIFGPDDTAVRLDDLL